MKKYLMGGIAAVAICAAFTSCSKSNDIYDQNAAEQAKQQTSEQKIISDYQTAFENAFGKPASNQDWGLAKYGSIKKAGTRAAVSPIQPDNKDKKKPEQPTFSSEITMPTKYKNTLEDAMTIEGIEVLNSNYKAGGTYYIDAKHWDNSKPNAVDIQNRALTIYFDGDITFYGNNDQNNGTVYCVTENSTLRLQSVRNHLIVYLAPNATLDLTGITTTTFQNTDSGIFLCDGSKVYAKDLSFVGGSKIRNNGYIEADNLTLNGQNSVNSSLWNEGEVKVKETLTLYNQDGEFINRNKLEAQTLDMKAGGKFNNVGTTTITGTSYITNTNSWWENDGKYTTGTLEINNARRVYNNCNLTVNGNFLLKEGEMVLNGGDKFGASVVCESFTFELNPDFWMGNKSLLKVTGEFKTKNFNKGYGIRGIGSDYAVIQAGSITKEGNEWNPNPDVSLSYYGKLFIDTPTHFAYDNDHAHPRYVWDSDVKFSFQGDDCPVVIEEDKEGNCNPGYKKKITYQGRIMGEDLTAMSDNDFDFNDVVFDWAIDGNTAYIKLYAAGGTLPLKIGTAIGEGQEVHALFGVSTSTMVNTGVGANGITKEPIEFTITKTDGTFESAADIIVSVDKTSKGAEGYMQMTSRIGEAPCLLFVPLNTKWVDEYENIEKAYTWFGEFVGDPTKDNWGSAPVEKYVDLNLSNNK